MSTEKRILDTQKFWASHIIFDIEGTTTSISFVKDTLFPYIRTNLEKYLNDNWSDEGFQCVITALREQAKADENDGLEGFVAFPEGDNDEVKNAVIKNVLWQMDNDRKTKSLKDLQSLVMTNGYETGKIIGHIYDDVDTNLKAWKEQGKLLYIYSSGSVNAQKLLFGNTNKGNLLNLFSGHFDTLVGPKIESSSYKRIVDEMKSEPGDVLFFTDVPAEAKAAVGAGLQAVLVSRDGNAPLLDQDKADFTVIHSFSDVEFEQNTKKRKMLNDTNCDIVIDNKEVERSSTYISEAISREGDDQIKPNISLDTDVEMVEVEEKAICTKVSKEETEILEEKGSKESDVDMKVQPNPELIKDNMKSSESIGKDLAILSKNESEKTIVKNPWGEVKNNDIERKKKKDEDIEGKKDEDIERKKDNVEGSNEHDIEGKEEHDGSVVAHKYKCSADGDVSKESSITDSNEDAVKPVEESNENTVKSIQKMSDNQHLTLENNENVEVENKGTDNEMKNSVDSSDKNEIELARKSKIQDAAVKTQDEDRNEIRPVNKDEVEPAQTSKTDTGSVEMINLSENSKSDINDIGTDGAENKQSETITVKEAYHEKNTHAMTISEDINGKEDDVTGHEESPKMLEAVSSVLSTSVKSAEDTVSNKFSATVKTAEKISNTASVKISENTMSNTTAVEISVSAVSNSVAVEVTENAVLNTTAVEIAEYAVSNTTAVETTENAVSNTTAVEIAEKVVSNTTAVKITENAVTNNTAVKMEEENVISNATPIEMSESAISNTTEVEMAEKVVSDTMAVEIAENAVSTTTANKMAEENAISNATSIEISESAVSNNTAIEIAENVVSNTTALKIVEENAVSNATAIKMAEENASSNATSVEISESAVSNTTAVEVAENVVSNTTAVEIAENAISNTTSIEISENAVSTAVEIAENAVANTTALKMVEENTVANATSVEIAESAVSNTMLVETAENAISNNTIVKIAENVSNSTAAEMIENADTVEPMDVSESNEDSECKADVLNPEENKPLSNEEMSRQNGKECDQEMITDEITETNETTVCNIDPAPEKKIVEKEDDINTKIELQEKIIENSVCSKMETENCDTCEKDNILNEKSVAKKTVNDSDIELQKEESKPLKSDGFSLGVVDNINEKENNEESMKTLNSKTEDVCINNLNEKKIECSDVSEEKIINTSHEKGNCSSVVAEKEDVTAASVAVNGKHVENYSCDIEKNKSNGDDIKAQVEVTPNGDTHKSHENIKTDDEKTDTINEKTESNTVVNGGTENIDSVPEMKKVINDAANNSALEAISQPV